MDFDPEGKRLPIKVDSTSNGEFIPALLTVANHHALKFVGQMARKLGISRRKFLLSSAGSAATLLAFNQAHGATGGFFDVPPEAAYDLALAEELGKKEFIFDVQAHGVDRLWRLGERQGRQALGAQSVKRDAGAI